MTPAMWRFEPRVVELDFDGDLSIALSRLRTHRSLALLDSAAGDPCEASVLGFDPLPEPLDPARGIVGAELAWRALEKVGGDPLPPFFHGGFLGAFAYDLGVAGERPVSTRPEPFGFPAVLGGLYTDFVVRDERARRNWLVLGDAPGDRRPDVATRRARVERELAADSARVLAADSARVLAAEPDHSAVRLRGAVARDTSSAEHRARIERCRERIAQGEIYQANLAHRLTCRIDGDPLELYRRLRARNPAPYMGLVTWDEGEGERFERRGAVLSSSPELLFDFDGTVARSRPIKGTIARAASPDLDARARERLLASEKDLAELVMIVDLARNDLGKLAEIGGVWVEGLPTLKSYARVHHLMADVCARVGRGAGAFDLLRALFPGGSISGCPKLRALEIIAELEGEGRGFFCGSLGFVDTRGRAAFNVLIRTALWRPGELSFRVGGGITFASDAAHEDRETIDKARGILDALEGASA